MNGAFLVLASNCVSFLPEFHTYGIKALLICHFNADNEVQHLSNFLTFQVLTVMTKMAVFWDVEPCILAENNTNPS
jgi:hypothetical protein